MSPRLSAQGRPGLGPVPARCPGGAAGGCGFGGLGLARTRAQPPRGAAEVGGGLGPAGKVKMLAPSGGLPPPAWPQGRRFGEKRAFLGFAQQRSPAAFPRAAGGFPGAAGPVPARCRCLHPPGSAAIPPPPPRSPGHLLSPPALSITSRRPQAFGTPWGWYRHPLPPEGGVSSPPPASTAKLPVCPAETETPRTGESSSGGKIRFPSTLHAELCCYLLHGRARSKEPAFTQVVGRLFD